MDFLKRPAAESRRVALFPGSFHPVTRAHVEVAREALRGAGVDEVCFVMPRRFPHKEYSGWSLDERMSVVCGALGEERAMSAAVSEGGLFRDIATEAGEWYRGAELWLLCGRDAAERIVRWNYEGEGIDAQLERFGLLVANREGCFECPDELAGRVRQIRVDDEFGEQSATEVRRRILAGEPWRQLVPEGAVERIEGLIRKRRLPETP